MATFHHPHFCSSNPPTTAKPSTTPSRRIIPPVILQNAKKKEDEAWKENKKVFVDCDGGNHSVSVQLSGIRKADFPQHKRVRVAGERFQKDWSINEVVQRVLGTKHWEDIEGLLNRWVGRFTRKNFPVLIRESEIMTRIGWSNCDECQWAPNEPSRGLKCLGLFVKFLKCF
ncbi:pentatricopeptide repeat-containing protein At2g41720-like [Rhododendron vialii]|uniref:pentatricopeptide repeat-containing protein At2g41720-like n=1 Tax=Rhododendron vialii TaxID=182163 RepID=UPI00265EA5C2|nr:pentatricopeptide repeat-containing protein At2g41720-like [Rhododendron vialii]